MNAPDFQQSVIVPGGTVHVSCTIPQDASLPPNLEKVVRAKASEFGKDTEALRRVIALNFNRIGNLTVRFEPDSTT